MPLMQMVMQCIGDSAGRHLGDNSRSRENLAHSSTSPSCRLPTRTSLPAQRRRDNARQERRSSRGLSSCRRQAAAILERRP